jgi:hypothetical protein
MKPTFSTTAKILAKRAPRSVSAVMGLILVVAQIGLISCQQARVQRARVKEGKPFAVPVKLSGPLDKSSDLSFLHVLDESGVAAYQATSLAVTIPAQPLTAVDLTKMTNKTMDLTSLKPKLNYEASGGAKKKITCQDVALSITTAAANVTCVLTGDDSDQSQNETISGLAYKIPDSLAATERESWVSMVTACMKNGDKPYGRSSDKSLVGCYCAKSGSQWAFAYYQEYAISSPQEATRAFQLDCGSTTGGLKLVDSMANKCAALKGTDHNKEGCYVCSNIKDVLIDYQQYFTVADPLKAFEQDVQEACSGP